MKRSFGPRENDPTTLYMEVLEDRILLSSVNQIISPDGFWRTTDLETVQQADGQALIQASEFELYNLDRNGIAGALARAPMEYTSGAETPLLITIPTPEKTYARFAIVEAPIMHEDLAAQFPGIKTYRGQGLDDPAASIRFDLTPSGFHAQILSPNGTYYVDPYYHLQQTAYMSYFRQDFLVDADAWRFRYANEEWYEHDDHGHSTDDGHHHHGHDHHHSGEHDHSGHNHRGGNTDGSGGGGGATGGSFSSGDQLFTYEAAVAATGEYTQFHGGTVALGQAAVVTAMNRVVGIYEVELAIRMELVPNNSSVIYTNGATDPYTNNNGGAMLTENQNNLDAVIGSANYDIGHVFSTGGGGVAFLGVVGNNAHKAKGVTGLPSPIGDPFYVDYVSHEMGHQYGANHTFNGDSGSCSGGNRNGSTAYEPGSGSTIQAYAGICGNDNLQTNSDAYFHHESHREIRSYVSGGVGFSSATITATGNSIPTANAGANYTIPAETPYILTGSGSDADGGQTLTYQWEERDLGPQQDVNAGDNGSSPLWRSWTATTDPSRIFPRLTDLINNTTVVGETLPTTNRTMDFRFIVRDNASGGGGVNSDDMIITVVDTGAPFRITSQNSNTTWVGGTSRNITWDVAGTTANGINTPTVNILLSTDGGLNYNTVLVSGTTNDGAHTIIVPNLPTGNARIKVEGVGNIFFDINDANIQIDPGGPGVDIQHTNGSTQVSEDGTTDIYNIALTTVPAGSVEITVNADAQTEVSLDGSNFSSSVTFTRIDTSPRTITVRAIDDTLEEGPHTGTITHSITATNDPVDYPLSLSIPNLLVNIDDNDVTAILTGVDFDEASGASPTGWTQVNGSATPVTYNNLPDEEGMATPYDLTISEQNGLIQDFAASINAGTLPSHPNSLANLDGQIYTGGDPMTLTWSDLTPGKTYEVYVVGLEGFFASITQLVTITGEGVPISFTQNFNQNDLYINDELGSSSRPFTSYAELVVADSNGQIVIDVAPTGGTDDVVLGGVAIKEFSVPEVIPAESGFANITSLWQTIAFNNTYVDPVVIVGPASLNDGDPVLTQVRNIDANGFEVRLWEWDYQDGPHATETVGYLVIESGVHQLADGNVIVAGKTQLNHNWKTTNYGHTFSSAPVVVSQVSSAFTAPSVLTFVPASPSGHETVHIRHRNVGTNSFQHKLQEEQAGDGFHIKKDVGWLAFGTGVGVSNDLTYESVVTPAAVTHANYTVNFTQNFGSTPIFLATMQTYNGADPAAVRVVSTTTSDATFFLQEEQSADAETNHGSAEKVGYVALNLGIFSPRPGGDDSTGSDAFAVRGKEFNVALSQSDGYAKLKQNSDGNKRCGCGCPLCAGQISVQDVAVNVDGFSRLSAEEQFAVAHQLVNSPGASNTSMVQRDMSDTNVLGLTIQNQGTMASVNSRYVQLDQRLEVADAPQLPVSPTLSTMSSAESRLDLASERSTFRMDLDWLFEDVGDAETQETGLVAQRVKTNLN